MSSDYTAAGNMNFVDSDSIYAITTADFDAVTDVDVLAKAFNIDRANWLGRHVSVDSFGFNEGELNRLDQLLADDPTYVAAMTTNSGHGISTTENNALKTITAIVMDEKWLQVYDVLNQFTEIYNPKGLYWNEFFHVWRIYSASPFVNALMFSSTANSVTSVTVSGPTTGSAGNRYQFTAAVVAGLFTNKGVTWSTNNANVTIGSDGLLNVPAGVTGSIVVTAKSVMDGTKTGTKTIVIS